MEEYRNYYNSLCRADWFYEYSDDFRVYSRGRDEVGRLRDEAGRDEAKQKMFDEFRNYVTGQRERPSLKEFGYEDE